MQNVEYFIEPNVNIKRFEAEKMLKMHFAFREG